LLLLPMLVAKCDAPRAFGVNPVGTSYFPIRLITDQPTDPLVYIVVVLYMFCIAIIGYGLFLRPLLGNVLPGNQPAQILAAFVPGYIMVSAFNRLITILLPHSTAPAVIAGSMLLVVFLIGINRYRAGRGECIPAGRAVGYSIFVSWMGSMLLLWSVTVYVLQRQVDHITGDAFVFLDSLLKSPETGIGTIGHLAVISQHYDELSVLYPLLYGLLPQFDGEPLVCFWILYGFFVTGALYLVYGCARMMKMNRFESLMILLVLFFGMYSVYPGNNAYLLFDSGNPLAQCLHPGRIFGALMPVAALSVFVNRGMLAMSDSITTLLLSAVFCLGVATTTISNVIVLGFLTLFWIIGLSLQHYEVRPGRGFLDGQRELILARLLYLYPFACCLSPASKRYFSPSFLAFMIAAICALLAVMLIETTNQSKAALKPSIAKVCLSRIFLGGLAGLSVSMLLFGNIFIARIAAIFGSADRIWDIPILTRRLYSLDPVGILKMIGPYESSGNFPLEHTYSPAEFVAHFGLIFIMTTSALYFWSKIRENRSCLDSSAEYVLTLMVFLALFMLAFLMGLFGYDYMAAHINADQFLAVWLRSRLLEPWFYAVFFVFLVLQRKLFAGRGGLIFFTLFTIYLTKDMLVFPAVAVRQWLVNAGFFFEKIL